MQSKPLVLATASAAAAVTVAPARYRVSRVAVTRVAAAGGDLAHCHWCQHAGCANHLVQLQLDAGELPVVNYHVFLCTVFTAGARAVRVRAAGGKYERSFPPSLR